VAAALMQNPTLAAFSWERRARDAEVLQAGRWPNPELAVELENFAGSGELAGFIQSESTIGLFQLFELGGKRGKREQVAALERDLSAWDYETRRLDVLTEVSQAFVAVLAAQEGVALASDLVQVADEVYESVARRVRLGAVSPVEANRALVELETSRIDSIHVAQVLAASRRQLATTWGSADPAFSLAVGDLEQIRSRPSVDSLQAYVRQNPDVARWATEVQHRDAEMALAKANGKIDLNLGAGVRHFEGTGENALLLAFQLPLPVFDRNQGSSQAAEYRLMKARYESEGAELESRATLGRLYDVLTATEAEVKALREDVIPEAEKAFTTAQDTYQRGLMRFTDVLDTKRTLFELRRRYYYTLASYHVTVAGIERLIGESLEELVADEGRP